MSPEQWNKMMGLFHQAREQTEQQRVALLDSIESDDPAMRRALEQMLRDDEAVCSLLDQPRVEAMIAPEAPGGMRLVPGAKFGRYELIALIGRGGMGEVWCARDPELRRSVALKFLSAKYASGHRADLLTEEARAASALNHPNIVTVHEVLWHDNTPGIVMELVEGEALRAVCGTPQPAARVVHIGLQAARALAAAHACNLVHRDIKPENILVRPDGYVKLVDFGIACRIEERPAGHNVAGTFRYMSPEQARGEPVSPASDVFSLGRILCELATGRAASSLPKSGLPPRLNSLIVAMVAPDPAARPTAEKVARVLTEIEQQLSAPKRMHALRRWTAAGGLLSIVAIFAIGLWVRHRAPKPPAFHQLTTLVPENRATAAAISPDGNWAAYANVDGIFLQDIRTGEVKALRSPHDSVPDSLAWFRDGSALLASGFSSTTGEPDIWSVSISGAPPRLLRMHARLAAPSPDGKLVAFVTPDRSAIWLMDANGEHARGLIAGQPGETFGFVFWSPDGRSLGTEERRYAPGREPLSIYIEQVYKRRYQAIAVPGGRIEASVDDVSIESASWLPDGRLLFLGFEPGPSALSRGLWEVKTDPRTGKFLNARRRIPVPLADIGGLTSTSDGKLLLVIKEARENAVFVGDFDEAKPRITASRRLTLDAKSSYPHAWTRDNQAVIFESDRRNNWDIFKQNIDQRTAEPIVASRLDEVLPQLSPDGRFVLYEAGDFWARTARLMRVPVNGGTPEEVPIGGPVDEFRCPIGSGKQCVLRVSVRDGYRAFYDLDPVRGKGAELARTQWSPQITADWDTSPDGKYVAIPNHDSSSARIRVLSLDRRSGEPQQREVLLPGLTDLNGLVWAASGKGWFVSVNTAIGSRLFYVYLDGRFRPLGDIKGWAVPSPDGHRVAFLDRLEASNAWIIDRR